MEFFDSIKELFSSFGGDEIVSQISEQLPIDDVAGMTDQLGEQAGSATEQATSKVEDIKNSVGL